MGKFGKFYFCEVCDLRQPNPASLVKHMREDHHCEEEFVARNPDLVHNFSEVCPSCGIRVINVAELLEHATLVHEFNGTVRQEVFQSFIEFEVRFYALSRLLYGVTSAFFRSGRREWRRRTLVPG